jgi:hypothetical protein
MQVYSVGPDDVGLDEIKEDDFQWVVYWYKDVDSYSGDGELIALGKDNLFYFTYLGHCSCYGPLDGFNGTKGMTKEEVFKDKDSIFDFDCKKEIMEKVKELM